MKSFIMNMIYKFEDYKIEQFKLSSIMVKKSLYDGPYWIIINNLESNIMINEGHLDHYIHLLQNYNKNIFGNPMQSVKYQFLNINVIMLYKYKFWKFFLPNIIIFRDKSFSYNQVKEISNNLITGIIHDKT